MDSKVRVTMKHQKDSLLNKERDKDDSKGAGSESDIAGHVLRACN